MADTYTNSLRVRLQANGANDSLWGTYLNTGALQLLEDAIAGRVAVTHDDTANYTLTTSNGATDEARRMIIDIGGALGAARNVVVPTQTKFYVVKNSTTGGYSVTVKTSAGTGITVPNGKLMLLYCDGTNVVEAVDTITSPTFVTSVIAGSTTMALLNTVATTVNAFGAATTLAIGAAASATTWTGQSFSLTGANSTNNTAFTIQNTSNAAAASHAYQDIAVGGTTSTGDPHTRWTIPGGTSWYAGADNSDSDIWKLGTGTAVGTNTLVSVTSAGAMTVADDLAVNGDTISSNDTTFTLLAGPTTVNFAGGASVALNIGHADAAAAFAGGISIPTAKNVTGTGTAQVTGFATVSATTLTGTLSTAAQTNITSVGALDGGSITNGFGSIDVGADSISGGAISGTSGVIYTAGAESLLTLGGDAASTIPRLRFKANSAARYNFQVGINDVANDTFTIVPSTAIGGTTFTTAVFAVTQAGAATIGGGTGTLATGNTTITGGVMIGSATGGIVTNGLNVAGDVYKNNSAYTNPDYVLEHWATGKIVKYADKAGAKDYVGLRPLNEIMDFARKNWHLPRFGQNAGHGVFSGGDALLATVEESYLYLHDLDTRLQALEEKMH